MKKPIDLVPAELRDEFQKFVDTGEASKSFLKRLSESAELRKATDLAFAEQIDEFVRAPVPPVAPAMVVAIDQVEALPAKDRAKAAAALDQLRALGLV